MITDNSFPLYNGASFRAGLLEPDIFYVELKGERTFLIEDARELLETGQKLNNGRKMYNLFVLEKTMIPDEEVLSYVTSQEVTEFTMAQAYVVKSLPQRMMGNFLIRFKSPKYPIKLFNNIDVALNWIKLLKSEDDSLNNLSE